MKKAVLFTLSMFLLVMLVFNLALIFSDLNKENSNRFNELSATDRLYDLDSSLQNSIKELFNAYSGITVNVDDINATIQEPLPNPNKNLFNEKINSFKNYVESNFNEISLNVEELNNNTRLLINDVSYDHNSNFGGNIINITPNKINFNTYYFRFYSNTKNATVSWPQAPSGNLRVIIIADGSGGWHNEKIQNIDPSQTSTATINGLDNGNIELTFANLGKVKIENKATTNITLKTAVTFNNLNNKIHVYIPNVIRIIFKEFNIAKNNNVKVV